MTMHEIVLCADEETMRNPALIGLEGESLETQEWLHPISGAEEAREYMKQADGADEVWVASSNEVDPINLAATLKRDCADKTVCLVAWRESGSLRSRAAAAGIDEVLGYREMALRYSRMKRLAYQDNPRRRTPQRALAEKQGGSSPRHGRFETPPSKVIDAEDEFVMGMSTKVAGDAPSSIDTQVASEIAGSAGVGAESASKAVATGKRGYALTVVSASGGTGKSTVAVLSALIAASHGYRTLLLDADLQFGDVTIMLGECGAMPIDKVVADPSRLDEAVPERGLPVVVSAPDYLEHYELYLAQVPGVIDRARDSFDVVVVNTGSFWTESHIQLMEASSNTLFLMDQRPTTVKAMRRALELCSRCGVAAHPFLYAINRCSRTSLLSSIDISCALNGASVAELKEGGSVVGELTGAGLARKLVENRNELCVSLNDFLGQVVPSALGDPSAPPPPPHKGRNRRSPLHKKGRVACL